jgi:hypothetical protein
MSFDTVKKGKILRGVFFFTQCLTIFKTTDYEQISI